LTPLVVFPFTHLNAQINQDELQNAELVNNAQNMALLRAPKNSFVYNDKKELVAPVVIGNQAILNENRSNIIAFSHNRSSNSTSTNSQEEGFYFEPTSDQISVYIVHEGDTIEDIAKMFNVSANTIRWANNLGSKTPLKKDQQLVILPISGVKYTVKKGDTIKGIAKSFKGDEDEIIAFNDLEINNELTIGSEIIIPNGEMVEVVAPKPKNNTSVGNLASRASSAGYLLRPLIGGVRTQGLHGHNGIDFAAPLNTPIIAAASGQVIVAKSGGWNGGYGSYVVIKHPNGTQTLYAHLNSVSVSQGRSVNKGDVIGRMGTTGKSTGVHLHFEVRGGANPF
jgi:LysM repeat protein